LAKPIPKVKNQILAFYEKIARRFAGSDAGVTDAKTGA